MDRYRDLVMMYRIDFEENVIFYFLKPQVSFSSSLSLSSPLYPYVHPHNSCENENQVFRRES